MLAISTSPGQKVQLTASPTSTHLNHDQRLMSELTFNDTVSKLSSITDPALFERLATAVLRSAKPEYYENLSHPGVNTSGKTVKSPFDGIGWISIDDGGMLIGAEHTTTDRDKLEGKWLHDPSTVKARRTGGKPTQPTGDLVKAIKEIKNLRESLPNLKARIALTCNCDDPSDVRVKVQTLAAENNVELDIWSVSRIAQYLDINSEGQVIRYQYLGSKITRAFKVTFCPSAG